MHKLRGPSATVSVAVLAGAHVEGTSRLASGGVRMWGRRGHVVVVRVVRIVGDLVVYEAEGRGTSSGSLWVRPVGARLPCRTGERSPRASGRHVQPDVFQPAVALQVRPPAVGPPGLRPTSPDGPVLLGGVWVSPQASRHHSVPVGM